MINWLGTQLEVVSLQSATINNPKLTIPNNSACPHDLKTLTELLLKDLPGYGNRVIQRARKLERTPYLSTYIIVAGNPDFKPLPLNNRQYNPVLPDTTRQIFFTTLERQYSSNKVVEAQNYHWLFLTQTQDGWRLVMVYTQFGSPSGKEPPTPPQETSDGVIGQAIRLWLRDCRAGAIKTLIQPPSPTIPLASFPTTQANAPTAAEVSTLPTL
jgi:hypothetical protein